MNQICKTTVAGFLNFTLLANQILADLPPITFDTAEWVPMQSVGNGSTPGWLLASGSANISAVGTGMNGGKALRLPANALQERTKITREVSWDANEKTAFIDFQLKPAADPSGSFSTFSVNGTQLAFQVPSNSSKGEVWVLHGSDTQGTNPQQWMKTAGTFDVNSTAAVSYFRVTLRQDYLRNLWDLFIDGKLVAVNLAFEGRGANLTSMDFYGSKVGDTLVDDLSAQTANMLFQDSDKDGLPDSWETANGSNPLVYDRDSVNPATQKSFLDGYMDFLWGVPGTNGGNVSPPPVGIPPLTLGTHQAVGAMKGSLSVGSDGNANYSVPIDLPKGTGGMEPKLSLGYSSSGGNGIVGVGWSLTGLQRITRGPSSAAKDGTFDPMDFDSSDRFFLDGERLVCVAGNYGEPGSEYRTEMDSYARITAVGAGPASWKVETKAGLIVSLGQTPQSRISVSGGTLSWGVNRVSDTTGNYYEVEYLRDAGTAEADFINQRVSAIHYTGNNNGLAPYCHVYFDYENRSDSSRSWSTYAGYRLSKRLSKIRVATGSQINFSYRLTYENSYQSGRSFLKSVAKHMADSESTSMRVSPTVFNYDGLTEADFTQNGLWEDPGITRLPVYGTGLDATGEVNSMVTVESDDTLIRLTGDVARAYKLDEDVELTADTRIKFEFKSVKQVAGAIIGFDNDKVYQSPASAPLYRIGGNSSIPIKLSDSYNYSGPISSYSVSEDWKTMNLPIGTLGTGTKKYLILMCADNDSSDGVDNAIFRNIRIYNSNTQQATDEEALKFAHDTELLRYSDSNGKDLGVVAADLDSDGLVDLADWRAINYQTNSTTSQLAPLDTVTYGQVYQNIKDDFLMSNPMRPPGGLPLGCRSADATAYGYNKRHHLLAQPMDIDGDGKTDLMGSLNIQKASGKIRNDYGFYMWENGAWAYKAAWKLPFYSVNTPSSQEFGGYSRDEYFQWVDLNSDGYLDLILHTTPYGQLYDSTTNALLVDVSKGTAFLNKGKNGPGWIKDDSWSLPEPLMKDQQDVGRRVMDLDGDGVPEIAEASIYAGALRSKVYRLTGTGSYRWNSTRGLENPPANDAYKLPAAFVKHDNGYDQALLSLDLNGDGLVDLLQSRNTATGPDPMTWMNQGYRRAPWQLEPVPTLAGEPDSYAFNHALSYVSLEMRYSYGYETADINGDGLVDMLYSDSATDNTTYQNTGTGWRKRDGWGLPGTYRIYTTTGERENGKRNTRLQDLNGDGFPDLITDLLGTTPRVWTNRCRSEVLTSVVDGFGTELTISYRRLNDLSTVGKFGTRVYQKSSSALPAGHSAIMDSRLVVCRYTEPNGFGGTNYKSQRYGDLRYDRINEASLGFGWIDAMDELTGQISHTETSRIFPFGGSPLLTTVSVTVRPEDLSNRLPNVDDGDKLITTETATYGELPVTVGQGGTVRRPVQTSSTKTTRELDGTIKAETRTYQNLADFDSYGFVKKSSVYTRDGFVVSTDNTYSHFIDAARWQLGRLTGSTVTKTGWGKATITKTSSFTYDDAGGTGLLKSETVQPSNPLSVTKSYTRDAFGNITKTDVTASGTTRTAHSGYDSKGRFLTSESNALGHTVSYSYNDANATLTSTTASGLTTSFFYDAFGTLIRTLNPDGTETGEITGLANNGSVPASVYTHFNRDSNGNINRFIAYFRAKQSSGTPVAKVYFDAMGREMATETLVLRNAVTSSYVPTYTVTKYDWRNRKNAVSNPFASGETAYFTTIKYDLMNRVVETVHPDGSSDTAITFDTVALGGGKPAANDYNPMTYSMVSNRDGKILERWENQHGLLVKSKDPSGLSTWFNYDLDGRLLDVSLGSQNLLTNTFDLMGNKLTVNEKNSGTSSSIYNGFGEVTSSTNAKGDTTWFEYDVLGRPWRVTRPGSEGVFTTVYDGAIGNAKGKPWKTTSPNGYFQEIAYDNYGRVTNTRKTQFGETFLSSSTYDALGRVYSETNAGGLTVIHRYDTTYGDATSLEIGPGSIGAGKVLWAAGTYDSQGHALTQTLAQGVTTSASYKPTNGLVEGINSRSPGFSTDDLQNKTCNWLNNGNLNYRTDLLKGRTETFTYDGLNRVTGANTTGSGTLPAPEAYTYDTNGNLLTKAGATLAYNGIRPNAVSSATIKGQSRTYAYDNAGYVTGDGRRTYVWTSFGQLSSLTYMAAPSLQTLGTVQLYAAAQVETNFDFDAGGSRARQTKTRIGVGDSRQVEETLYLGSYERETRSSRPSGGGSFVMERVLHRHSIGGFAVYTQALSAAGTETKLTTILKDHLGSTDVLYTGTWNVGSSDFTAATTERQSFDPWGERRNAENWTAYRTTNTDPYRTSSTDYDRGYTGHEQLDDSGLIHMNGRIYDPELGRMLSPDPVVQVPEYSQNFNRYSYVMNNPLNMTDPTGFSWVGSVFHKMGSWASENWKTVVVIVVAAVLTYFTAGAASGWATAMYASLTTTATGVATAVSTTATIVGNMVAGAYIGAVTGALGSALAGGDLGDVLRGTMIGGISGAMTGAMHGIGGTAELNAANVVGHGVVGGASNVAMGGKFQDGFLSAAASAATAVSGLTNPSSQTGKGLGFAGRTAIASAAGGTASALGGGKFANGAVTGAFHHLLNAEAGFVKQALDSRHCGPATVANAIRSMTRKNVTTEMVAADIENAFKWDPGTIAKKGLIMADIVQSKVLEKYGVKYESLVRTNYDAIKGPAIVARRDLLNRPGAIGHVFLLLEKGTSFVKIVDPFEGRIEKIPTQEFKETLDLGYAINLKK